MRRLPSWQVSLIPFVVLTLSLVVIIKIFGPDALSGGSQVCLLLASAVTAAISMFAYKNSWEILEFCILDNIRSVGTAILILLLIGAIAGTWMVSGIVPAMICYGMQVIYPAIFLAAACAICALVSLMTGSSWTTIATIGVALIGIGVALGFEPGWTAGAIVSGAYFGDKVSPLSDTTVLASSSSGTPLFTHIRYMMITTIPSLTIAMVIFLVASLMHKQVGASQTAEFAGALKSVFNITPWLLIVPALTGVLIVKKVPAVLTLFCAAVMAAVTGLVAQPQAVWAVANPGLPFTDFSGLSFWDACKGITVTFYGSTAIQTGNEAIDALISTRGMTGMLNTIFLIVCSVTFGGVLAGSGMLKSLTELFARLAHRAFTLVGATVGTGLVCNIVTGDQYISILLTSSLYKKLYERKGYENRLLSRSVEDSATVTSVLIPWNSCGMTQATVLKVPTLEYLPYSFFNILSPFMSVLVAAVGYRIFRSKKAKAEEVD
ncbi:Na+/H+ antiporter NhaC family protein [Bacteroides gallinaceum]|uniref:Na+/H+ antiporter NhaC family protein n=2 Tax=Bacteroidaceae TaxID=815 RepID=A0ABT7X481_9BACE|nr:MULTISPECIES: Na+/H+ antiporter NhaC family protein [Bacteroidaceae]MBD8039145.1 sodium:proton antiporter [Phocaeicola intestinalis]MBM6718343.1 sodium:proton antiporter [Bacteroides gallinaceum]MBM6944883.1 sodium:proton antiporter [Bacteroides gallinaceum]MDN0048891.1 Na+/H+ antiporter NhaC family protein [Bacteroides gallinaceum]MDN0065504.1 Na+/H+ antiporter NhaC family protein [Bacteroides gallinaceum]